MRLRRIMVAALVLVAIGSAARALPRPHGGAGADPSTVFNLRPAAPDLVLSTLRRACFDCHSEATHRPWYATLPIASHLIERDVTEGRGQLNLSRWTEYNPFDRADMLDKMCELASSRKMPPWQYRLMHPGARLSATDVSALCAWTQDEAERLMKGEK
jgi:Haem-binding domain